jgi:Putative metallopeptidase
VMSSLMFVFLHEVGHGLISLYKLPSVGREEDAADQLAAFVLIETGDTGLEVAMNGAQFFRLLALSGAKTPFFDEHALDAQRYYNLLCLVYGSNPQRLGSLVGNDKLPASRARRCPSEYGKISSAWASLLGPHVRKPSRPSSDDTGYAVDRPRDTDYPRNTGAGNGTSSSGSGSEWSCRAVASYAPQGSSGPDYSDPQNIDMTKWGRTRDEAGLAALDACADTLAVAANSAVSPGSLVLEYCKVLSCSR